MIFLFSTFTHGTCLYHFYIFTVASLYNCQSQEILKIFLIYIQYVHIGTCTLYYNQTLTASADWSSQVKVVGDWFL